MSYLLLNLSFYGHPMTVRLSSKKYLRRAPHQHVIENNRGSVLLLQQSCLQFIQVLLTSSDTFFSITITQWRMTTAKYMTAMCPVHGQDSTVISSYAVYVIATSPKHLPFDQPCSRFMQRYVHIFTLPQYMQPVFA